MKKYLLGLLATACITALPAHAQSTWPTQPVRFIVSQSAGGSIDIAARLIGQKLGDALGKTVVVDNRAGANGMIAGEAASRATDGHTFLMTSPSTLTINQHVYKKVPYDVQKDFTPVTQTTSIAFPAGRARQLALQDTGRAGRGGESQSQKASSTPRQALATSHNSQPNCWPAPQT